MSSQEKAPYEAPSVEEIEGEAPIDTSPGIVS